MKPMYDLAAFKNRNYHQILLTTILGIGSLILVYGCCGAGLAWLINYFVPPYGYVVGVLVMVISVIYRYMSNQKVFQNSIDNFLQFYHAQRLMPTQRYQQFFNVLDEICIGTNVMRPDVYLVDLKKFITADPTKVYYEHLEERAAYDVKPFANQLYQVNLFGLQLGTRRILVINQAAFDELSRYELAALMAIELGYLDNWFNTFLLWHHIMYATINKFVNVAIALMGLCVYGILRQHSHVSDVEFHILIWSGIVFLILISLRWISYRLWKFHSLKLVEQLEQRAIDLTSNPQILIHALEKVNQNNYNPIGDSMYNQLWLNPLVDESGDAQDSSLMMQLYRMITNSTAIIHDLLLGQQFRISIVDRLQLLYQQYLEVKPTVVKQTNQSASLTDEQIGYEQQFDESHVNLYYLK